MFKNENNKQEKKMLKSKLSNTLVQSQNMKSMFLKSIRTDQLSYVKDKLGFDLVLGTGRFGTCKLMHLQIGRENIKCAAKHYFDDNHKDIVFREAHVWL